ncbi:MAG: hypothetical protein SNJ52_04950, partial [Verrucomicrobiia bacterium]
MNDLKRSTPQRHWLSSAAPLAEQAAHWLLARAGDPIVDLSRWMVIVPTRNAARLLGENLAKLAEGRALLAPDVVVPSEVRSRATTPETASSAEMLIAWARVFSDTPPEEYAAFLPRGMPADLVSVAARMVDLEENLCEGPWDLADPSFASHIPEENERWEQIGSLARAVRRLLDEHGLVAPAQQMKNTSRDPMPRGSVSHIVLVGVLEVTPWLRRKLAHWGDNASLDILIHAPNFTEEEKQAFDEFGCPLMDFWRETPLEPPSEGVRLVPDPDSLGEAVVDRLAASNSKPPPSIVVADPALRPPVSSILCSAGVPVFDPSGLGAASLPSVALLARLVALGPSPLFAAVTEMARSPAFLERLCDCSGFGPAHLLIALDDFSCAHVPTTLDAACRLVKEESLHKALEALRAAVAQADR